MAKTESTHEIAEATEHDRVPRAPTPAPPTNQDRGPATQDPEHSAVREEGAPRQVQPDGR